MAGEIKLLYPWANANVVEQRLKVELGFVDRRPKDDDFRRSVETEAAKLGAFLGLSECSWELRM